MGCYLKSTKLLDCALIGVCVVIRSNTVYITSGKNAQMQLTSLKSPTLGM